MLCGFYCEDKLYSCYTVCNISEQLSTSKRLRMHPALIANLLLHLSLLFYAPSLPPAEARSPNYLFFWNINMPPNYLVLIINKFISSPPDAKSESDSEQLISRTSS